MNEAVSWKGIVLALALIYFFAPVDLVPMNLVDDFVVLGGRWFRFLKNNVYICHP